MTAQQNPIVLVPDSLVKSVAINCGMDAEGLDINGFKKTLMRTVIKDERASGEQIAAFLMVAKEYDLNPITKEIYAFPDKSGGIQPIVSIDGWLKIINSHPQFNGMDFEDKLDDKGNIVAITCRIYRKDREHPVVVTEYMNECARNTDPWKKWPARMLRHKTAIQAGRYAFGFSGIMEPDEFERSSMADKPASAGRAEVETYSGEQFQAAKEKYGPLIESGKKSAAQVIAMLSSKAALTEEQAQQLKNLEAIEGELQ